MSLRGLLASSLLVVGALAGCRVIAGYRSSNADAAGEQAQLADLSTDIQIHPVEDGPPDAPRPDQSSCTEQNVVAAGPCSAQRVVCTPDMSPDRDCDGLDDDWDIEKTQCNTLLFQDECQMPWSFAGSDGCTIQVDNGGGAIGTANTGEDLWVIGFRSSSPLANGQTILFRAEKSSSSYRSCIIGGGAAATLTIDFKGSLPYVPDVRPLGALPAGQYVLVAWGQSNVHYCALYNATTGEKVGQATATTEILVGSAKIKLAVYNTSISVDYVRVFDRPDPA